MSTTLRSMLSQLVCCRSAVFSTLMTILVFQMFSPNAVNAAISEVYNSETMSGPPSQPGITKICTFSAFGNASSNHALVINNLPGITNPRFDFSAGQQGTIAFFSDGTARLTGRLVNKGDANQQWDMDFYFSDQMDWAAWSALGRDWKNEGQGATNQYLNWEYFIFDPNKPSTLTGAGSLTGSSLVITHMPADYHYGFQVGDYANCKNGNYGAAAWFFATGTVNGSQVSNKHGDINLNLGCRNVTKECPIDEYASGSHVLWLNNLISGLGNNWVNIPGQNLSFLELTGGEAAIYGKVQNQNNNALKLTVSYWFNQKSDWATWSGLGRSWKGNAGIVGSNFLNWDYYIFNTSIASTLIGCSPATLNSYLIATHMPANYQYGLQVGTAANDKNGNEGLSTWFFLNGQFQGSSVNGKQGDVNGNTNCAPPFLICIDTPPVITCPNDITIDCSASTDPANTGVATSDRPNSLCPGDVIISYSDALSGSVCPKVITRTWNVVDEYGNSVSCDQIITVVDTTAPVLEAPAVTSVNLECSSVNLQAILAFVATGANPGQFINQVAGPLFLANGLVPTAATDNCDPTPTIVETGIEALPGECPGTAILTCFFQAQDDCGNLSNVVATTINIVDTTAPVLEAPAVTSVNLECSSVNLQAILAFVATGANPGQFINQVAGPLFLANGLVPTAATDNCDPTPTIVETGIEALPGECPGTAILTCFFQAQDDCGNLSNVVATTINIVDTTAPVLDAPTVTSVNLECSSVNLQAILNFVNTGANPGQFINQVAGPLFLANGLVPTAATDNCDPTPTIIETGIEALPGDCPGTAVLTCFFQAQDDCGNLSNIVATTINIVDTTPPVISCPANITVDCTSSLMPSVTGTATASDNCGDATVTYTDGAITGECTQTLIRTWTATDECGNTSTCTQTITITDTTAPVLIMPEQTFIHITCTAVNYGTLLNLAAGNLTNGQANAYRNFLRNIFMTNGLVPTGAEDDCNEVEISETSIQIITEGLDCPAKAIVRCVFIATDACGNVSDEQYTELIVIDQTTPHIFCPSDIVVVCGSDTSPSVTGFATATDNCSGPMDISYYDTSVTSFCPTSFVRVWVAEDGCGNVATCEQLITLVEDDNCTTAPTGLVATVTAPNTVLLTWNPVPGSIGCRVFARALGSNNTLTIGTVVGNAPSQLLAQSNLLYNGLTVQWRVICACSTNPLVTTPFSPWNTFTYNWSSNKSITNPDSNGNSGISLESGRVYPNPTLSSTFLNAKMSEGDVIMVRDISGMTVTSIIAPAESDVLEIDMKRLAAGVYFIQHIDRSGIPHVYKVIKN